MNKNKLFKIITIICFASIILIPIGVVLMIFYTDWNKKIKISLGVFLPIFYVLLLILFLRLEPANNSKGIVIPVSTTAGSSEFDTNVTTKNKKSEVFEDLDENFANDNEKKTDSNEKDMKLPKSIRKGGGRKPGRAFFSILFLLFMLILIIYRNLKNRNNSDYENPYLDTKLLKFPLSKISVWPTVHFQKISRKDDEKFLFACEAKFNMSEGDLLISDKRFVFKSITENVEFDLPELETAASVSNSCFVLTRGDKKFYFFVDESQMKYALGVLRFACGQEV